MSGVTKLTIFFNEKHHKITIFTIFAPKRRPFVATSLIERTSTTEAGRRKMEGAAMGFTNYQKMSGSA